jgi:hypothetical protein
LYCEFLQSSARYSTRFSGGKTVHSVSDLSTPGNEEKEVLQEMEERKAL